MSEEKFKNRIIELFLTGDISELEDVYYDLYNYAFESGYDEGYRDSYYDCRDYGVD